MEDKSLFTVGIAALTSKLCRLIARRLLTKQHPTKDIQIRAYVRDPSRVPADLASNPRVHITVGDSLDKVAIRSFVRGCDVVMCGYLGLSNEWLVDSQKLLVDACEAEGIPRYFPADFTLDYTKLKPGQLPQKDPMIVVREYIEDRRAAGGSVQGVYVLCMGFMDTLFSSYFQLWKGDNKTLQFWGPEDEPVWEMTSYRNSAEYAVEMLLDETAVGVQKILGERASIRSIAADMEEVYGIKPKTVRLGSAQELYDTMHESLKNGDGVFGPWIAMFYQYYIITDQCQLGPIESLDNKKYPDTRRETLKDFFRRIPLEELNAAYGKAGEDN